MESKKIAIIGAGVSGLLACKHCMEKGQNPVVFEAETCIGGVWSKTLESTKLQTPKSFYQFSDFPWPSSVNETFPDHNQVLDYLNSYASHFNLLPMIKFNAKVLGVDYCATLPGYSSCDLFDSWDSWGGSGGPFSTFGKWNVTVQDTSTSNPPEVYEADFVILCIGNFSGLANIPEFPLNKGPEVFEGRVMHAMDFASMENEDAAKLIAGKHITIIGSRKTALDLATEAANLNGPNYPCTLLFKNAHWMIPEYLTAFIFKGFNRFAESMVHKPDEHFFQWLFTLILSPLLWIFSKMMETFLRSAYPMKKYNMVPDYGFTKHTFSCSTAVTPPNFFDRVRDGSIVPMKITPRFNFCKNGLIFKLNDNNVKDEEKVTTLKTDIVIFATGYKPDQKLQNIFSSAYFKKCISGSSAPFYRECVHPRIPNLVILGYADSPANIYTTEMKSKWVSHFLAGKFELPSIKEMEQDSTNWEKCKRSYTGSKYKRYCATGLLQIYTNDQLCKDMGFNPKRKSWFLADFFAPYGPTDYKF